jgi:16S rRNA C967 or C1407 C5-methylase (RsmB/RsmF family)/NOL1/NOP2/fmu family ribosome biogenesis protein
MIALPATFLQSLEGLPGYTREAFLEAHAETGKGASVRINTRKYHQERKASPVPWCTNGYYLEERPAFVFDPLFHAGAYYVQEASSMFLDHAWRSVCGTLRDARVLDLCAAPGGKSTLLAAQENITLLLSNEIIRTRVPVLYENIVKWGEAKVLVSSQDPKDFQSLPAIFDAIVVDAPCSGSGLFRKDPDAVKHWSPESVALCSQRQQRILADALPCLKEGGYLFYSTCSYAREEDEDICDWLVGEMGMETVPVPLETDWGIVESRSPKHAAYGYRFYPHRLQGEGFFLAVFRNARPSVPDTFRPSPLSAPGTAEMENLRPWLYEDHGLRIFRADDVLMAFPQSGWEGMLGISAGIRLRRSGLRLGTVVRGQFNPDHELAVSTVLSREAPSSDLGLADALRYLKRELTDVPSASPGWLCLRFQGLVLGMAKKLQNRINNYYPQEWRIRADLPPPMA